MDSWSKLAKLALFTLAILIVTLLGKGIGTAAVQIAAGGDTTAVLKPDGTVLALGDNSDGKCEVREWQNRK